MSNLVTMIDAGFLREAGRRTLGCSPGLLAIQPKEIMAWCRASARRVRHRHVRAYWYDAAPPAGHAESAALLATLDELRNVGGFQLRLGKLVDRPTTWRQKVNEALRKMDVSVDEFNKVFDEPKHSYEQKGVDTLLVLDMIEMSRRGAYNALILVAGDADVAEAVRIVQSDGKQVILVTPGKTGVSKELIELADEHVVLSADTLRLLLLEREDPIPAGGGST